MARDLSVRPPNSVDPPSNNRGLAGASVTRQEHLEQSGRHTYLHCGGVQTTDLDSSTESEGYSDSSSDNVDARVSELQGESEQGERLYRQFLVRRFGEEELNYSHPYAGLASINYQQSPLDTDLATLADVFSRSAGREDVRLKAEQVEISSITQENFTLMLSELFHDGGITQERILVLFFFCSDLAIRAVRSGLQSVVSSLTRWTVGFLRGTVAAWVRCRGGWDSVLNSGLGMVNQLVFLGVCAAVITVCVCYIRKNW